MVAWQTPPEDSAPRAQTIVEQFYGPLADPDLTDASRVRGMAGILDVVLGRLFNMGRQVRWLIMVVVLEQAVIAMLLYFVATK